LVKPPAVRKAAILLARKFRIF